MLQNSFIHIPGIGEITERRLWTKGLMTWDDFLNNQGESELGIRKREAVSKYLFLSKEALSSHNYCFFEDCFPSKEKWRLFDEFKGHVAYLDIETTGLSPWEGYITVIGLYDGEKERAFIMGDNLDGFADEIAAYKVIVTFNGARFDIPFIRQSLNLRMDQIHIDLMYPLKRLGYSGGLKAIEQTLGIFRPSDIGNIDGFEAVRLWFDYHRNGNTRALERLVKYNLEDTRNLKVLMELVYERLKGQTFSFQ
ncbi:MAG: ribonuclease H-like domain-containing protein [bacterium]